MSTASRRKNTAVAAKLNKSPQDFPFVQSVRLLERSAILQVKGQDIPFASSPVGGFSPPAGESVRFSCRSELTFPAGDIERIEVKNNTRPARQWRVTLNMIGLTGAMGVLPYHYSELVMNRRKIKDHNLEHFLDLFNHRTSALFYRASTKYRLPLSYEQHRLYATHRPSDDNFTQALLSLSGIGTQGLQQRLHTSDDTLAYYSGLFSQKVRSSSGLQQMLRSHFAIPIVIEQFVGQWQPLIDDVRTRLPHLADRRGRNAQLGRSAMLGRKGWYAQGKIRIILGPLGRRQLDQFAPGTDTLKALNEMVRLYAGMEQNYEFVIRVLKSDIPERIRISKSSPPLMGWNTWLSKRASSVHDDDATMDISVSPSRLT